MIVKVQISLFPAGTDVLIYPEAKDWMVHLSSKGIPTRVLNAVRRAGKVYWHAEFDAERGDVIFNEQAPAQDW